MMKITVTICDEQGNDLMSATITELDLGNSSRKSIVEEVDYQIEKLRHEYLKLEAVA